MTQTAAIDRVRVFAPAKINLCLHVGARRADGYHELASLVVFATVGDELAFQPDDGLTLAVRGPFSAGLPHDDNNLVVRAARLLGAATGSEPCARITLDKRLPVASGIGGGSADAAATLRGLVQLWSAKLDENSLAEIAAELGSDVPMCLFSRPALAKGRGEQLRFLPDLPGFALVLVNPGIAVSTPQVFARLNRRCGTEFDLPLQFRDCSDFAGFLNETSNDLQAPAIELAPVIGRVLETLQAQPQVLLARLSGSGATCFGLVKDADSAAGLARDLQRIHPDWWVTSATIASVDMIAAQPF